MKLKVLLRTRVVLIMIAIMLFFRFYRGYDKFKEMSLDSKYNMIKEFNKLFINFKSVKTKKKQKKRKHNLKKSESLKMSTSFTKTIIIPIKVTLILMMS